MADELEEKPKKDASPGDVVKRWDKELELSAKKDTLWTKDVEESINVYRNQGNQTDTSTENRKRKETFNILWANIETKRATLYNNPPRPDIRRRWRDESPVGKAISELLERCVAFTFDASNFDGAMISGVNDMLVTGRGVTRVRHVPTMSEEIDELGNPVLDEDEQPVEKVDYQEVQFQQVQWDKYRNGPGRSWEEIPWIAFLHEPTKDQAEKKWPEFYEDLDYSVNDNGYESESGGSTSNKTDNSEMTVFSTTEVWEIWDKDSKQVIWYAPSHKKSVLEVSEDPMELAGFFPIPEPMYAIESSTDYVPVTEYSMYETMAKELETITNRIIVIMKGLKVRGIYDSRISELENLFDESDNGFIPAGNSMAIIEKGGLQDAIWMLPIETIVNTLIQLYQFRQALLAQIYEVTGISDIMRGNTNPNETLGAQKIKANFGNQRTQTQQTRVQIYARDIMRISVDIISGFSRETLSIMSGLKFPTKEEKEQVLFQAQQLQQQQQPIPPQVKEVLEKPSWEEIEEVLQSDIHREFLIDVETNSTIAADEEEDKRSSAELLSAISGYFQQTGPLVTAGVLPPEVAKAMLLHFVRKMRMGREVEDELQKLGEGGQQKGPDPEQQAAQAQAQADQQKNQAEMQMKQMEIQKSQQEGQIELRIKQMELQQSQREFELSQQEHALKMQELNRKAELDGIKHQRDMQKMQAESVTNQ